jgi:hypothetical protein
MSKVEAKERIFAAVIKLIDARAPDYWKEELTEMFSGWIGSQYTDGMTGSDRMGVYSCYADLCELFDELKGLKV